MSNVVLALLTKTETAPAILKGAGQLARLLGDARVEGMVILTAPMSTIMPTEEILSKEREQEIRDHEKSRAQALHRVFDQWAGELNSALSVEWVEKEGTPEELIESYGGRADYIVVGRPDAHAERDEQTALHTALFETDRPVLIMPPQFQGDIGKTIAIAWRDDKFTLRAVLAALRCIAKADAVHVLMGRKDGAAAPSIPQALTEHGIQVTPHELAISKDGLGAQLLAEAHEKKADLLVMGAFTHSKWHDMLFGGVTKHILAHADLPIMMRH